VVTNNYILQGGGEHARVVVDCIHAQGGTIVGIFDPAYSGELFGVPQLGVYNNAFAPEACAIVAIGDNALRKKVVARTTHKFSNAVHPTVILSPRARIGLGNMLLHGSIIQAQTQIGNHCIINTGAQVDHDCNVGDYVHLAPGSVLCGCVTVGEGAFIGARAVVVPGKKIGVWATVGAGAVVLHDVPDYAVVVGNPGRIIKINKP
jgi:sugar O-acyltransferase (sialic acid O-acetyltransferase NeuD family)